MSCFAEQVPDSDKLVAEETFGPIMPLLPWKDMDDLVQRVNSTPYGLQAGVFTDSVKNAKTLFEYDSLFYFSLCTPIELLICAMFFRALDVGALALNAGPGFRSDTAPFGGVKESGLGREGVAYAVAEMQYKKTLYM
jgi:acyl-CoA reductase-like NAD-dependent aldehyde dehydrogenase